LERQQRGDIDVTGWLGWFLACLGRAILAAEASLSAPLAKARLWERINQNPVDDRQRLVINRLLDGFQGNLTTAKHAKLAKCSTDTSLRAIFRICWNAASSSAIPPAAAARAIA
jgi:Fic family protein